MSRATLKRTLPVFSDSGDTASDEETASFASLASSPRDRFSQGEQHLSALELVELLAKALLESRQSSHLSAGPRPRGDSLPAYEDCQRQELATSLVIRRLQERDWETDDQLRRAVLRVLATCGMSEEDAASSVLSIRRVGSKHNRETWDSTSGTWLVCPRVVIVEFSTVASKMAVKSAGWRLSDTMYSGVSLDHALTTEQQHIRASQWGQIQVAKAKGWKWCWSEVEPHKLLVFPRRAAAPTA